MSSRPLFFCARVSLSLYYMLYPNFNNEDKERIGSTSMTEHVLY